MPKMSARQALLSFHYSTKHTSPRSLTVTVKLGNLPIKDVSLVFDFCVLNCRSQLSLTTKKRRSKRGDWPYISEMSLSSSRQDITSGKHWGEKGMLRIRIRCLSDPWIRNSFYTDPGSRIPNPYFWELSDNFLGKKFYNSLKIFFFSISKIK